MKHRVEDYEILKVKPKGSFKNRNEFESWFTQLLTLSEDRQERSINNLIKSKKIKRKQGQDNAAKNTDNGKKENSNKPEGAAVSGN